MTTLWILTFAKSCVRVHRSPAIPEIPYVYFRYRRESSRRTLSFSFLILVGIGGAGKGAEWSRNTNERVALRKRFRDTANGIRGWPEGGFGSGDCSARPSAETGAVRRLEWKGGRKSGGWLAGRTAGRLCARRKGDEPEACSGRRLGYTGS